MVKGKKSEDLPTVIYTAIAKLGFNPVDWKIDVNITKGVLTATRGAVVEIESVRHGVKIKKSVSASTKTEIRQKAVQLGIELVKELSQSDI